MNAEIHPLIPGPATAWQLWYLDRFDLDSSPSLEASGERFIDGLYRLWFSTLREGILDNGSASFSSFFLTWGSSAAARADLRVQPFQNTVLLKLRRWANLAAQPAEAENAGQGNPLIGRLAQLHYELLQNSPRWQAEAIDWDAEAGEVLAWVEGMDAPAELDAAWPLGPADNLS